MEGNKQETQRINQFDIKLNNSPFQTIISDKLETALNESRFGELQLSNDVCGTISWDMTAEKLSENISALGFKDNLFDGTIEGAEKDINAYFEKKISGYCFMHNVSLIDWSKNGIRKQLNDRVEYYYLDEFICGIRVIEDSLFQEEFKVKKTIILEYY
jgi:hypothetical protein